jgi:hypothetical protein
MKTGDKLWFVHNDRRAYRKGYEVEVLSIGRKWATLSNHERINIETMWADGRQYSSPGRCWPSKAAYVAEIEKKVIERVTPYMYPDVSRGPASDDWCIAAKALYDHIVANEPAPTFDHEGNQTNDTGEHEYLRELAIVGMPALAQPAKGGE